LLQVAAAADTIKQVVAEQVAIVILHLKQLHQERLTH
jgi:hypothetical protein